LRGVAAASERVAYASGSGGTVLKTIDAGESWRKLTIADDAATLDFRDIDAINADVVYALSIGEGDKSRIYKTTDGGETWTQQFAAADPKSFYDAMAFWDADHGIVFGDSIDGRLQMLLTSDGGRTWTPPDASALPAALANEGAFAGSGTNIAVVGPNDAWIGTGAGPKCRVLHTSDRGRTWAVAETPIAASASAGIFSVAFRDRLHGVVVGGDYRKETEAIDNAAITSDGGRTWTLVRVHGFRSAVRHVPGTASTFVAVGPQGADISIDDGRTWTRLPDPGPLAGYDTLSFAPGTHVAFAAGARGGLGRLDLK
jgi:photosystem II stability/assembly factor-like uncharacterized protein